MPDGTDGYLLYGSVRLDPLLATTGSVVRGRDSKQRGTSRTAATDPRRTRPARMGMPSSDVCALASSRAEREQGRRKTFTAVEVTVPGLRRLAEDYVVEPAPDGSRFIWTLALEPHPTLRPILRLTNPVTVWMLRRVARGMRSRVRAR